MSVSVHVHVHANAHVAGALRLVGEGVDAVGEREERAVDVSALGEALAAVARLLGALRAGEVL